MGADGEGTHERVQAHLRELIEPKINEHRGRIVKNTGDGFPAEFASVVEAVRIGATPSGQDDQHDPIPLFVDQAAVGDGLDYAGSGLGTIAGRRNISHDPPASRSNSSAAPCSSLCFAIGIRPRVSPCLPSRLKKLNASLNLACPVTLLPGIIIGRDHRFVSGSLQPVCEPSVPL